MLRGRQAGRGTVRDDGERGETGRGKCKAKRNEARVEKDIEYCLAYETSIGTKAGARRFIFGKSPARWGP